MKSYALKRTKRTYQTSPDCSKYSFLKHPLNSELWIKKSFFWKKVSFFFVHNSEFERCFKNEYFDLFDDVWYILFVRFQKIWMHAFLRRYILQNNKIMTLKLVAEIMNLPSTYFHKYLVNQKWSDRSKSTCQTSPNHFKFPFLKNHIYFPTQAGHIMYSNMISSCRHYKK